MNDEWITATMASIKIAELKDELVRYRSALAITNDSRDWWKGKFEERTGKLDEERAKVKSLVATVKDLEAVCWSLEEKLSMANHSCDQSEVAKAEEALEILKLKLAMAMEQRDNMQRSLRQECESGSKSRDLVDKLNELVKQEQDKIKNLEARYCDLDTRLEASWKAASRKRMADKLMIDGLKDELASALKQVDVLRGRPGGDITIEYDGRKHAMSPGDRFEMTHTATVVYE